MPGEEVKKIVKLKNISEGLSDEKSELWGAIKVIFEKKQADGTYVPCTKADMVLINDIMDLDINTAKWSAQTPADDNNIVYVYNEPLAKGEESEALFTTVSISEDLDNDQLEELKAIATDAEINIKVTGAVIQAYEVDLNTAIAEVVKNLTA
mgnify:CR=1 FL=1